MSRYGKVKVVVKSRRVPVATIARTEPIFTTSGVLLGYKPSTMVLYGERIPEEDQRTIAEAEKFACSLDLELEVVDKSKSGFRTWLASLILRNGSKYPSVVVAPSLALEDSSAVNSHGR